MNTIEVAQLDSMEGKEWKAAFKSNKTILQMGRMKLLLIGIVLHSWIIVYMTKEEIEALNT